MKRTIQLLCVMVMLAGALRADVHCGYATMYMDCGAGLTFMGCISKKQFDTHSFPPCLYLNGHDEVVNDSCICRIVMSR